MLFSHKLVSDRTFCVTCVQKLGPKASNVYFKVSYLILLAMTLVQMVVLFFLKIFIYLTAPGLGSIQDLLVVQKDPVP